MPVQQETNRTGRKRWLRVSELPFSRQLYYKYFRGNPEIITANVKLPGASKGVLLIDSDSVDRFLEKVAARQAGEVAK